MKAACGHRALADAVALTSGWTVPARLAAHPALSMLHVRARVDRLTVTATDGDAWCRAEVPAAVYADGAALLPAGLLAGLLADPSDEGEVELVVDSDAVLTGGRMRATVRLISTSPEDHPAAALSNPLAEIPPALGTVGAGALRAAVARVKSARARSGNGVPAFEAFHLLAGAALRIVATDRSRLAGAEAPGWARADGAGEKPVIMPDRLLLRLPKEVGDDVVLRADDRRAGFSWDGGALVAGVVAGDPIPADKFLALHAPSRPGAELDRAELDRALARVVLMAPREDPKTWTAPAVQVALASGSLLLRADNETGTAEEFVPAGYDGPDFGFRCNWHYLRDAVTSAGGERVTLAPGLVKRGTLASFRVARLGDDGYAHVVMVLRG